METNAVQSVLQVPVFGGIVVILALVVRNLFNKLMESYKEKEEVLRESLRTDTENIATLRKAIELFEARGK